MQCSNWNRFDIFYSVLLFWVKRKEEDIEKRNLEDFTFNPYSV